MRTPAPLPPILRSPAYAVSAARDAGVDYPRLRRGDLVTPHHGARIPREEADGSLFAACAAYRAVMPASQCFSHQTAAALYGISLPARFRSPRPLHVSTLSGGRAPRGANVAGHKVALTEDQLRLVRGMRVPAVEEVWVQLAADLDVAELIVAGDACVRRQQPLSDPESMRRAVDAAAGRIGIRRLRDAIERVRPGTDSPMESLLRMRLVDAGLPEPAVNLPIFVGGGLILHGDLVYPAERVVVEYDGDHHRTDRSQYERDVDRIWALEQAGWRVVRINRSHIVSGSRVAIDRVASARAQQRGRKLP